MSAELKALVDALTLTQSANYSTAAAFTFLIYDICTTFPDEVEYIWSSKWSFAKGLYFVGRYYSLVYLIVRLIIDGRPGHSIHLCKAYWWYNIMGGGIPFTIMVNMIFTLRIHALYHRSRTVLLLFITLCLGESVAEIYACFSIAILTSRGTIPSPPGVAWPGCLTVPQPQGLTLIAWSVIPFRNIQTKLIYQRIPCILVACAFCLASLLRLRRSLQDANSLRGVMMKDSQSPLVVILIRDGTIYFTLILAILIICASTTLVGTGQLYATTGQWLIVVYSYSATQLILNLRRAASAGRGETFPMTTTSRVSLKKPRFMQPSSSDTIRAVQSSK